MTLQSILVPVDFSDLSLAAARFSMALAERHDAKLSLLHVDRVPAYGTRMAQSVRADVWEAHLTERNTILRRQLQEFAQPLSSVKVSPEYLLARGEPVDVIGKYTENLRPDLVVVTPSGAGDGGRFALGSVAIHVARESKSPVLVLRPEAGAERLAQGAFQRPLMTFTTPAFAQSSRDLVLSMSGPDPVVDLLYTLPGAEGALELPEGFREYLAERKRFSVAQLGSLSAALRREGVRTHERLEEGEPASATLMELGSGVNDLVVVAKPERAIQGALFVAALRVLRYAERSVLLVPFEPSAADSSGG